MDKNIKKETVSHSGRIPPHPPVSMLNKMRVGVRFLIYFVLPQGLPKKLFQHWNCGRGAAEDSVWFKVLAFILFLFDFIVHLQSPCALNPFNDSEGLPLTIWYYNYQAETQGRPETLIPSATAWGTDIHTNTHTLAQSKHRSSNFASILIGHSALNCVAQAILLRFLIIAALLAKRNASPAEQNKLHTRWVSNCVHPGLWYTQWTLNGHSMDAQRTLQWTLNGHS